jgi:spore coat protein CotH
MFNTPINRRFTHIFQNLLFLMLVLGLLGFVSGCGGDSTDGDIDGDGSVDGDSFDGDLLDGDEPDGDDPDGDIVDGDAPDGDVPDGDIVDGDEPDGDTTPDMKITQAIRMNEIDCHGRDWVEIVNKSQNTSFDISGWLIADDLSKAGHQFPLSEGSIIPPRGYLVVKQEKDADPGFPFGLKCGEDVVSLVAPGGVLVDQEQIGDAPDGSTWGRLPNMEGTWYETLPTQGTANQEPSSQSGMLFNPKAVYKIALYMSRDSVEALNTSPYEYVEAEFTATIGETILGPYTVGLRLKSGLSFRPLSQKAAIKIKVDKYDDTLRLFGQRNLTLNNMVEDDSMMHETIAYTMFRAIGVPAPRSGYATVTLNDEDFGLYAVIEKYDDVSMDTWFESTQHVYEGSSVDLSTGNAGRFQVDEGDKDDITDLMTLIETINDTADENWLVEVGKVTDLTEIVRMWAMENYIGQNDGYTVAFNNYFLHSDDRGIFSMLPWGTDRTFVEELTYPTGTSAMAARCFDIPACLTLYEQQLNALRTTILSLDLASTIDDLKALLAPYVADDPRKECTVEEFDDAVTALKMFLEMRASKR